MSGVCGGVSPADVNDAHIIDAFKDAVAKHNAEANDTLEFVKIVEATKQVVAGFKFVGKIECKKGEEIKCFHVDIWSKPGGVNEVQKFEAL